MEQLKVLIYLFDGGDNWVEAKLKGLVLPKSWTRFSYIYKWDGKPLFLSSRALR